MRVVRLFFSDLKCRSNCITKFSSFVSSMECGNEIGEKENGDENRECILMITLLLTFCELTTPNDFPYLFGEANLK